jgi:hypothetical protein
MHILEFFKNSFHAGIVRALTALAAFIAMATSFSAAARAQVVQPMYGVPVMPIVKYGPPATPTPGTTVMPVPIVMYGPPPSPIAAGQPSAEAAIAVIIAAALFLICIWAGLKFFLLHREK